MSNKKRPFRHWCKQHTWTANDCYQHPSLSAAERRHANEAAVNRYEPGLSRRQRQKRWQRFERYRVRALKLWGVA